TEVARIGQAAEERARRAKLERAEALVREAEQRKRRRVWFVVTATLFLGLIGSGALALWANHARRQAERRLAENYLDRALGIASIERDPARGMLWLVRASETVSSDAELDWTIRTNLTGWRQEVLPLSAILSHQQSGPPAPITATAFSPDGKIVLTASDDKTVRLWEVGTGKQLGQPLMHEGHVRAAAFSPDGE